MPQPDTQPLETFRDRELEEIERKSPIRPPAIYEVIRRAGEEEFRRPASALLLSGLAAGVAIGFSVLGEALLRQHLPATGWRPLVENFGYSLGFVIVILAQMQLFTENTITAVTPVLARPSLRQLMRLLRLWGLVLCANLVGTAIFGWILFATRTYQPETWEAIRALSLHATSFGATETLMRGIGAGWLMAVLVWMMASASDLKLPLIVLITYVIALADFSHVIAGNTEAMAVTVSGDISPGRALFGFLLPALAGNVLGGTVLFTALAWGQIRADLVERRRREGRGAGTDG